MTELRNSCPSVLRFLSRYLKGCAQISWYNNFCSPGWSQVHELVLQGKMYFLLKIGELRYWWKMLPFDSDHGLSCLENERIQPFSVINQLWFSSSFPSPAPSALLCYLSLSFAPGFPLVPLQKWHFCSTRQGKWIEGAFAVVTLDGQ